MLLGAFARYSDNPVVVELCEAVEAFEDGVDPEFVLEFQKSTIAQPVATANLIAFVAKRVE